MLNNRKIFIIVSILVLFGIFTLFNASSFIASQLDRCNHNPFYYVIKQMIAICIGIFFMLAANKIDLNLLKKFALPGLFLSILLLIIVLLFGKEINGARRWLDLGIISFQPSEVAEFFILIYLSTFISSNKVEKKSHKKIVAVLVLCITVIILIAVEPNISTAILITVFVIVLLNLSDIPRGYIFSMGAFLVIGLLLMLPRYVYAIRRLKIFAGIVHSEQAENSILAIVNGGFLGQGVGMGKFKLFFIPEVHSDFIFTTIAEEFGFIGSVILIGAFLLFLKSGIDVAKNTYSTFLKVLAFGITFIIFSKAMIHIAVSLNIAPATGLVLPFISYGGTAMLFNLIMVGLLMNIARENAIGK